MQTTAGDRRATRVQAGDGLRRPSMDGPGEPSYRALVTRNRRSSRKALTLVELLLVIALLGAVVGALLPSFRPAVNEQLASTAQTIAADIMYCRDLAVGNSSQYTLTFDTANDRYWLEHTGSNPSLDDLPPQPFSGSGSTATRHVIDLAELPFLAEPVRLIAAESVGSTTQSVTSLEMGPLGETTRSEPTRVWFGCGSGNDELYIFVEVDPVTGLVEIGEVQSDAPPTY